MTPGINGFIAAVIFISLPLPHSIGPRRLETGSGGAFPAMSTVPATSCILSCMGVKLWNSGQVIVCASADKFY